MKTAGPKVTSAERERTQQTVQRKPHKLPATGGSGVPKRPDASAFQAPEGTHAKRRKRPSRLKRNYRRAKVASAVDHWISVLAAVEEALQVAGELHGALVNEMHALEVESHYSRSAFANAGLHVRLQVLREQCKATEERVEQLGSVHATARAHLVSSQSELQAQLGTALTKSVPPLQDAVVPLVATREALLSDSINLDLPQTLLSAEQSNGVSSDDGYNNGGGAIGLSSGKQPPLVPLQTAVSSPNPIPEISEIEGLEQFQVDSNVLEGLESDSGNDLKEVGRAAGSISSSEEGSSLSGAFQNVLGQWAMQVKRPNVVLPVVPVARQSTPQQRLVVPKVHEGPVMASTGPSAAVKNVKGDGGTVSGTERGGKAHDKQVPVQNKKSVVQQNQEEVEESVQVDDAISDSDSVSSSSSGSSFGLQWGDTLRVWAQKIGADARASLSQQQQQQQQQKVVGKSIPQPQQSKEITEERRADDKEDPSIDKATGDVGTTNDGTAASPAVQPPPVPFSKPDNEQQKISPPVVSSHLQPEPIQKQFSSPTGYTQTPHNTASPSMGVNASPGSEAVRAWLDHSNATPGSFVHQAPSSLGIATTAPLINEASLAMSRSSLAARGPSTVLRCDLCSVSASGPRAWQDHLESRRHAANVAKAAKRGVGDGNVLLPSLSHSPAAALTSASVGTSPLVQQSKCYVGPNADVAPYVDHVITPELNTAVETFLRQLLEWQERTRRLDPMNARRKRRVLSGMREVEKAVKTSKARLLIVAPNINPLSLVQPNPSEGHINDSISVDGTAGGGGGDLLDQYPIMGALAMARERSIPIVFALSRQRMGRLLGARKSASAFAVLDASGAEGLMGQVLIAADAGREAIG